MKQGDPKASCCLYAEKPSAYFKVFMYFSAQEQNQEEPKVINSLVHRSILQMPWNPRYKDIQSRSTAFKESHLIISVGVSLSCHGTRKAHHAQMKLQMISPWVACTESVLGRCLQPWQPVGCWPHAELAWLLVCSVSNIPMVHGQGQPSGPGKCPSGWGVAKLGGTRKIAQHPLTRFNETRGEASL